MSDEPKERPEHPRTGPEAPRPKRKGEPDPAFTKEDFDAALKKVARKKPKA